MNDYAVFDDNNNIRYVDEQTYIQNITNIIQQRVGDQPEATGEELYTALNNVKTDIDSIQHRFFDAMSRLSLRDDEKAGIKKSIVKGMDIKSAISAINNNAISNNTLDKTFVLTGFAAGIAMTCFDDGPAAPAVENTHCKLADAEKQRLSKHHAYLAEYQQKYGCKTVISPYGVGIDHTHLAA
jgi:hypothetical protein